MTDGAWFDDGARLHHYEHDGLTFQAFDSDPDDNRSQSTDDRPVFLLLHGFPQDARVWEEVAPELVRAGYRVLALFQRGYTAGATAGRISGYAVRRLVGDAIALLDSLGVQRAHVVGHDWGGVVAWALAAYEPSRVRTLSVVSMPHPRALARSALSPAQARRSWYVSFFQLPALPERIFEHDDGRLATWMISRTGLDEAIAASCVRRMLETPRGVWAALAWYRAVPLSLHYLLRRRPIDVPTMFVWGRANDVIVESTALRTRREVRAPYEFVPLDGVGHWVPTESPAELAVNLLRHVAGKGPDE
jgi:pimeloyl-ACP methyl ester carboxylesterase